MDYKTGNYCKMFHSSTKLIASDSDIDEAFTFMDQSILKKIENYANKDWIALDAISHKKRKNSLKTRAERAVSVK